MSKREHIYVEIYKGYRIVIEQDDDPINPRRDWDNFGKMVCWHRRYNLGDEQPGGDPSDYFTDIARDKLYHELDEIERQIDKLYDRYYAVEEWANKRYAYVLDAPIVLEEVHPQHRFNELVKQWTVPAYEATMGRIKYLEEQPDKLIDAYIDANFLILPLYIYDHSGITMNTTGFSCPWDSGQVGYIYCTKEEIIKEYGDYTPENIEKACRLLVGEVKTYDRYLTGEVYGYIVEEPVVAEPDEDEDDDWKETDSCWEYYDEVAYVLSEARHVVDYRLSKEDKNAV